MEAPRPRHDFSPEDIDRLEDRLYDYNSTATGHADGRGLGFEYLDGSGAQVGAIAGHTWGGVAEIAQLWVEPTHRGRNLGLALLDAAVQEARDRGCRQVFVQSYDFQAPEFYEKRGFERLFEAADWPQGHVHVLLRLRLD